MTISKKTGLFYISMTAVMAGCVGTPAMDHPPDSSPCLSAKCDGDGDGTGTSWALNDVSILFPLPENEAARSQFLWVVPGTGEQGPFFPSDQVGSVPVLNGDTGELGTIRNAMVVALRYDPCFPAIGGATCQAQIRLVAQPMLLRPNGTQMLDDSAAHLFYSLSATESELVRAELRALKQQASVSTEGPLGVHPALGMPGGMTSSFADALRALIVHHCRNDNFIRFTMNAFFMDHWSFIKYDVTNGTLVRQPLDHLAQPGTSQGWDRLAFTQDTEDPTGEIHPAPVEGFTYFLDRQNWMNGAPVDPARASMAAEVLLKIENPRLSNPETTDCVSCHLSNQAHLFASRHGVSFVDSPNRYQPPPDVDTSLSVPAVLDGNLGATISFGYHSHASEPGIPSISQRVINDSAEVVGFLRSVATDAARDR